MTLTSSDIGTDPSEVELNLTRQFITARSWGAVLLIDEADVFMERRSTSDLTRNSLVAGQYPMIRLPLVMISKGGQTFQSITFGSKVLPVAYLLTTTS